MTVSTISSKHLICLLANLHLWYSIINKNMWKIGLLCSRPRSQKRFEMSTNVCPDDISWTIKPFVTKLGGVSRGKNWFDVVKVKIRVTARAYMIRIWLFCYIFLTADPFAVKLGLMVHSRMPVSCEIKWITGVEGQGHSKTSKCWLSNLIQLRIAMSWSEKTNLLSSGSRSQWWLLWSNYDCMLCLLNCWSFCNQTWFSGLRWIVIWND